MYSPASGFGGAKYEREESEETKEVVETGMEMFPVLKAAYPQVPYSEVTTKEKVLTGVNVALLTSPLWLPKVTAVFKGAPTEGVPEPKPVKEPPMIRVKNPWTGLWETRPARLIGYTDAGLPMYEGGQAPLAGFTEIQYTGSGGSTLGIPRFSELPYTGGSIRAKLPALELAQQPLFPSLRLRG